MRVIIKPLGVVTLVVLSVVFVAVLVNAVRSLRRGSPAAADTPSAASLRVIGDGGKKAWLQNTASRFNLLHPDAPPLAVTLRDDRVMAASLKGETGEPPALWVTSEPGAGGGRAGVEAARPLFATPFVLLTTRRKAAVLRPLLTGGVPSRSTLAAMADLAASSRKKAPVAAAFRPPPAPTLPFFGPPPAVVTAPARLPWGAFTWSHADPSTSAGGRRARGLLLADFAARAGRRDPASWAKVAGTPAFAAHLRRLYRGFAPADPALSADPTALARAFARDPSRCDVLLCEESDALLAVRDNPALVVLYPRPTLLVPQTVVLTGGDRLAPSQRAYAEQARAFLTGPEAVADALRSGFRYPNGGPSPAFAKLTGRGFAARLAPDSLLPFPPRAALDAAAQIPLSVGGGSAP